MIAVLVVGILATIALPSFREFIERSNVRSSAESVLNALQLARAEAVRRNERITFTLGSGTGATSWQVADSAGTVIQQSRSSGEGSARVTAALTPASATTLVFNGFGRVVGTTGLTKIVFSSASTSLTVQIEIPQIDGKPAGGQIRMCDPGVTTAGDPRRCLHD